MLPGAVENGKRGVAAVGCLLFFCRSRLEPRVNHLSGQAEFLRECRQIVAAEESAFGKLVVGKAYLAAYVVCLKPDHELAGIRPLLTAEIADVRNLQSRFLVYFAPDALFERFASLHKAGHKAVKRFLEVAGMYEQCFRSPVNQYQDGGRDLRKDYFPAVRAFLGDGRVGQSRGAACRAETAVFVPKEKLERLTGNPVGLERYEIVGFPQANPLEVVFGGERFGFDFCRFTRGVVPVSGLEERIGYR